MHKLAKVLRQCYVTCSHPKAQSVIMIMLFIGVSFGNAIASDPLDPANSEIATLVQGSLAKIFAVVIVMVGVITFAFTKSVSALVTALFATFLIGAVVGIAYEFLTLGQNAYSTSG